MSALLDVRTWLAIGCAVLASLLGLQTYRVATGQTALATEQRDRKDERLRLVERGLTATLAAKAEGDRRVAAIQGVIDASQPALDAARAAAGRLPDLDRRVRDATAALRACRGADAGDPPAAAGGASPEEAAGVLAELQRASQAAERARTQYADEAGAASESCEAIYGTLNVTPGPAVVGAE